jgi:hypothetical protein
MTRSYPECDSYVCEGCPRNVGCDIKELDPAPEPELPYLPDQTRPVLGDDRVSGLESEIADLKARLAQVEEYVAGQIAMHARWAEGV